MNSPAAVGAAVSGVLARTFMLRVAGLPVEAVHGLRSARARDWAEEVLAEEDRLRSAGIELSGPLAALVATVPEEAVRRSLLDLRRRLFNNRLPGDPAAARALLAALAAAEPAEPAGTAARTARWLAERERWEELRSGGAQLLAAEDVRARGELRRLAGEERLRLGLLLASPTLDGRLDAYLREDPALGVKQVRKMERSLLLYLYRTACKTSPFSTFTGVVPGEFRDGDGAVDRILHLGAEWAGRPQLNVVVLRRIADAAAADPARRADLPVAAASGWGVDDDRIRYVRRTVTAGDDSAPVSFEAAGDRLFFLRRSGALEGLMALLHGRGDVRYGELADRLRESTGSTSEEADRYLSALLDLGIVRLTGLQQGPHESDPLDAFRAGLRAVRRPWAEDAADRLAGAADCLARYAAAGLAERRDLLVRLRLELGSLLESLGAPAGGLPQTLLYEDVRACGTDLNGALPAWTDLAGRPLASLARILPAFDVALPQRLTLRGFFLARYGRGGRCEDLLRLVHDFHEDLFEQYLRLTAQRGTRTADGGYAPEENWLGLPEITALDWARARFAAGMRDLWDGRPADAVEIRLGDSLVEEVATELAPALGGFAPQSHFVQFAGDPVEPLVVLNDSFGGLCFPFTRFTQLFDAAPEDAAGAGLSQRLREQLDGLRPDGAVFAEIAAGSATTNLNLHSRLTRYQIVCPGELPSVPEADRLPLEDLVVEHDEAADRLVVRSRRLACEVVPLYLGYLVPMVLPEVPRTLLLLSPTSRPAPDVWAGVPAGPATAGVTTRPRVRHHGVVLARRSWSAPAGALPRRAPGEDEAAWYLRWRRWRRTHGVPDRAFATVHRAAPDGAGPAWAGGAKPQYVDFDSPLSLGALEGRLGDGADRVVLEEMLPAESALHVRSARGRHVAELALEIVPELPQRARSALAAPTGEEPVD
ncbi:lantibiotic dehydratase [Kitasatospora sp. NPDC059571]|uniref:lantibiotic dehydratase n=1 Tax=Kitasatospora sp. NPDC059571 TaxID=3346871 RepID=UPI0036914BFA